jgi:carboxyl-terminal processing protease
MVGGGLLLGQAVASDWSAPVPHGVERPDAQHVEIASVLSGRYFRDVDAAMLAGFSAGGVPVLRGDPMTRPLSDIEYEQLVDPDVNSTVGIGVSLRPGKSLVEIDRVFPNSPAATAGLRAGDLISSVDGVALGDASVAKAISALRGPLGHTAGVTVQRDGASLAATVNRDDATVWNVTAGLRSSGLHRVGYVSIFEFRDGTGDQVRLSVRQMLSQGAEAIVLDLRGSGGGRAVESVGVAEVFLPMHSSVLTERGAHVNTETFSTQSRPEDVRVPVTVLVDGQTANAAEVTAAALRDHGRAQIVGSRTSGTGGLVEVVKLSGRGAFALTSAEYVSPSGSSLVGAGLAPDIDSATGPSGEDDPAYNMALAVLLPEVVRLQSASG